MIRIVAKNYVMEDKIEEFKKLAKELVYETRKEPGCKLYDLNQDIDNKTILTFIEEWEDKAAVDFHFASPHFTRIVPQFKPLLSAKPEINLYKKLF